MKISNIFTAVPQDFEQERFERILSSGNLLIERILSWGHSTPPGEWYDQKQEEWVILLKGSAALLFEGASEPITLEPGDYVSIPAHMKHRVEWTEPGRESVWLAVHYGGDPTGVA